MTTRSLITKIRTNNALITRISTAESFMIEDPATKISPTERTTVSSLTIKKFEDEMPDGKKK